MRWVREVGKAVVFSLSFWDCVVILMCVVGREVEENGDLGMEMGMDLEWIERGMEERKGGDVLLM